MFVFKEEANILHADLDSFFASVEQRDNPRLLGRPVIVGAGVVLAASYEAKAFGIKTAMPGRKARELCPEAIVVSPRFDAYTAASREVFKVFDDTAPVVEGLSIDEAFIDVRGMRRIAGAPVEIAARLRERVRDEIGLPITVGVARTKFLAKVASGVAKPDGLLLVEPSRELEFLHPLPVEKLWGVGVKTADKLHARGITTVGEVAAISELALVGMLGRASGRQLHALSNGRDARRVTVGVRRRSIGGQWAIGRRGVPKTAEQLDETLVALIDRITRRLRAARRVARTVILRLRFDDFSRATRSTTIAQASAESRVLLAAARELMEAAQPTIAARGCTLVGLSLTNLEDVDAVQLAFAVDRVRTLALDEAVDEVRSKFGSGLLTRGVLLGRDSGIEMPLLPND